MKPEEDLENPSQLTQQLEREQVGSTALFGDWLPIETAPKNEKILLYCPERHFTNKERVELDYATHGQYNQDGTERRGTWSHHSWATHWMPLPSPPNAEVSHDAKRRCDH